MTAETILKNTSAWPNWQTVKIRNHHGINTPIFSLRTRNSSGIGEYLDLIPLIDWCKEIGFDVLQFLPINDSGLDSSPYNALSANALHPILISLHLLPNLNKYPDLQLRLNEFQELNNLPRVDYLTVLNKKEAFLHYYFEHEFDEISSTEKYTSFVKSNPWLEPYALFKYFKSHYNWKAWSDWPKDFESHHSYRQVQYHIFVQFLCFSQMFEVKEHAEKHGIFLKGDIPILISPDSADVWYNRRYFDLSYSAGAPPDVYCEQGQNWGFPLYNFIEQAKDGYLWWKERIRVASNLYHLYRIDHIVGFFRIWAIARGEPPINGKFIPEDENLWVPQGENLLNVMLNAVRTILPIGEDLGVIPDSVRESMRRLGICGTKIMRWERKWKEGGAYIDPRDYNLLSMTTVSTHDSETLQQWWKNAPAEAMEFAKFMGWEYKPFLSEKEQIAILKLSHHSGSLFHINLLQEYLDVFPELRWENFEDQRINIPGVTTNRNWTYRYRPYLEDICQHGKLKSLMKGMIQ